MKLNVPKPVAAYLAPEEAKDAEKLALCFTDDGTVHDEEEDHHEWQTCPEMAQRRRNRLRRFDLARSCPVWRRETVGAWS